MEQLTNLKLFSELKGQIGNSSNQSNLNIAYDEFSVVLQNKLQSEKNITELYYSLGFIRLELVDIQNSLLDEKGKKCLEYRS